MTAFKPCIFYHNSLNLNMPARVSLKISLLLFLGGLLCAVGMAFLFNYILSGPKLGRHYDFLLKYKTPVVSREILVIETDEYIEGSEFFTVLMTLTELEASQLILTGRLSPSATPITLTEADIRRRFIEEFAIVGSNIRNIFEGIRLGYVTPNQAPGFVEQVVQSAEQSRDRLITAIIDRDEDLLRSVAVFGNYLDAYSKPKLDNDGKLRRVKPVETESSFEHPVYLNIRSRYAVSQIETADRRQILWLRGHDGKNLDILLDNDGNIITQWNTGFRRIDFELFKRYEDADYAMLGALAAANELKVFSRTSPEKIPLFLGEYAQVLLDDLIKSPNNENRSAWVAARANYFKSLEDFFSSSAEANIIGEYEELIADMYSSDTQLDNLITAKNDLMQVFVIMNEIYSELYFCYSILKEELGLSLCIMGPEVNAEYSALLANVLITGSHIKPVKNTFTLFFSITASLVILIIIFLMRPVILIAVGTVLSILSAAIFSGIFIFYSYWIDPLIVLGSSFIACFVLFYCKSAYLNYRAHSFRSAYRTAVSKDALRRLINYGRPGLSEVNNCYAAVIAIKDSNLFGREDHENTKDAGRMKKAFYSMVKKAVFNAGGVIAGYEGDTVLACFGSPLELQPRLTTHKWSEYGEPLAKSYHPVDKVCALARQLLQNEKITWRFGIDAGECSFTWSPETGFSVSGRPAVRARILAARTIRAGVRALITESVRDKIQQDGQKIGVIQNEAIFEFIYS